jgi:fumarate reductase flavoprotein subunit
LVSDERKRLETSYLQRVGGGERIGEIREDLQRAMDKGAGVFRTGEGLKQLSGELERLRHRSKKARLDDRSRVFNTELVSALELEFMLDGADTIVHSALAREESRGSHARRDFPQRDDERFLAHTVAYCPRQGPPRLEYRPVRLTNWQPKARTY